eukprot:3015095-Rhodomonas_salina.1
MPPARRFGQGEGPVFTAHGLGDTMHCVCFRCAKQLLKDCDMLETEDQIVSPPTQTCGFKNLKLGCLAKYKPGTAEAVLAQLKKMGSPKKGAGGAAGGGGHAQQSQQASQRQRAQWEDECEAAEDNMDEDKRDGSSGAYWSLMNDSISLLHCIIHPDLLPLFMNMENVQNKDQLDPCKTDKKEFWQKCLAKFCDLEWKPTALFTDNPNFTSGGSCILDPSSPVVSLLSINEKKLKERYDSYLHLKICQAKCAFEISGGGYVDLFYKFCVNQKQ